MAKHTSSNELDGAAPVPSPITSPELVAEQARARKAQPNAGAVIASAETPPDYAVLGLNGEKARQAETLRRESLELGRKSTDSVFEWGRIVGSLHAISDDQKHFEKLARGVLNLSRTGAENYERVHQRLSPHRERLVRVGMIASGLYNLATAEPERIEEVMAACEAGQKLNGARIKAVVGKGGTPAASPDEGGSGGMKVAIAGKTAFATKLFFDTVHQMLRDVHVALEPLSRGGPVNKSKAETALMHPARLAGGLVESLVYAAQIPGGRVPAGVIHVLPVEDSRWVALRRILFTMGSAETWPKSDQVGAWLSETVVPQFEWALGSERAGKARAVLDERAVAAEAERVKAEKARERARAEQKKTRDKTRRGQATARKRSPQDVGVAADLPAAMASTQEDPVPSTLATTSDA
ncbi:hypothetical protein ASD50_05055 [Mesorhizobium sp. Root552]|uniref:hypothetical protein n=1 Tax=Mesorhizobium sp. Root552 TaxID=1736555 RepID=UPI0006F52A1C|nr:hypothetical protein [Mesorhizobium sp. Root552]KQZ21699.1 hypothetical protein ASD50_05055 [Mesorhizobium sp. Root552]